MGHAGVGAGGGGVAGGVIGPRLIRAPWNSFLDVRFPAQVRETAMGALVKWREAYQLQRIASIMEGRAPGAAVSLADELAKLKQLLDSGAITPEEYEKAKKKLLGE